METLLQQILAELKSLNNRDMLISAEAAARHCGMSEKQLNKFIDSGIGPEYFDVPAGRKFRRTDLDRWLTEKFRKRIEWKKQIKHQTTAN